MKSNILQYLKESGLKVSKSKINTINTVVFNTAVIPNTRNLTLDDGKHYIVDVVKNTSVEFTPDAIKNGAIAALETSKDPDNYLATAERCGLIASLKLVRSDKVGNGNSSTRAIASVLNLKVDSVTVDVQNDVIFRKVGLRRISGLVEDDGKYYTMNTAKNTATLIDPVGVAKEAEKLILKGEESDTTRIAESFNLVSAITLVAKD